MGIPAPRENFRGLVPRHNNNNNNNNIREEATVTKNSFPQSNIMNRLLLLLLTVLLTLQAHNSSDDKRIWTPTDVSFKKDMNDPIVTLCSLRLGMLLYATAPYNYPKFRDVMTASSCGKDGNTKKERMSVLLQENTNSGSASSSSSSSSSSTMVQLAPTAFIFHESRVGSTLVSNMLAVDPTALVYSESRPPVDALFHCTACRLTHIIPILILTDDLTD